VYTDGEPKGAIREYLNWIVGPEAQEIVRELGFVPISDESIAKSAGSEN
jgi:ABC-type phosphate transport system substrate-binding protein